MANCPRLELALEYMYANIYDNEREILYSICIVYVSVFAF